MNETPSNIDNYIATTRRWAERYLELGWSIIPLHLNDKKPAIEWKEFQDRQPTEAEVAKWFDEGVPDGNGGLIKTFGLAVITGAVSKLVVVDCDHQDAIAYAVNEGGCWSPLGVKTTRGQHFYFRHAGAPVQNKAGGSGHDWPDVKGLDLRGDGGYVVIPPTVKYKDGVGVHAYSWSDENLEDALFNIPEWKGMKARAVSAPVTPGKEFSFDDLKLDTVRTYGDKVWDEAEARVATLGHKMRDGEGRNIWLTKYVGECVSNNMSEDAVAIAADQFSQEFFAEGLPKDEAETVVRSVFGIDKRNHPEKYAVQEKYDTKNTDRESRAKALGLITPSTLAELRRASKGKKFLIDPYIAPQSIIQVNGFNGHGKTLLLLNMLYAAALGQDFGGGTVEDPLRVLYLDHESSAPTLDARLQDCADTFGPMNDNMTVWLASHSKLSMNMTTSEGIEIFKMALEDVNPQIVVIDTVRSAYPGLEENSPGSWVKINNLMMAIRNTGRVAIFVHHRNKPGPNGMGREAGSTAQLKDLDTQIFVTKVVEDATQAKTEAALADSVTEVVDFQGNKRTAYNYLRSVLPVGFKLAAVFQVTFGKVRQATDNHVPVFVGVAKNITTGKTQVVSSKTPRQKTELLHSKQKRPALEIAGMLQVPVPTVENWIAQYIKRKAEEGVVST